MFAQKLKTALLLIENIYSAIPGENSSREKLKRLAVLILEERGGNYPTSCKIKKVEKFEVITMPHLRPRRWGFLCG
ncbi:MAG: hypothetical protein NZ901_12815 [Geminocystis sp.]|nr:hypothetical protein [Geminocystis sp.]HIK38092.1 hypothetical protein [Geminocystis sp. M7585_C2015_104]MCS7149050.1 hypothetical protein [Geminocystis sp.]MCX8077759.1 hypothetical protein [Geminocystis sp.]MDW8117127.1 hypothetical protein [Geminocystis sp.]